MWSRIRCDVRSFANNDLILDQPNRAQPWGIYLILMRICINIKYKIWIFTSSLPDIEGCSNASTDNANTNLNTKQNEQFYKFYMTHIYV